MVIFIVHLLNYTLSFLMWMIVGRALLTLIAGNRETLVTLAFAKVTEPAYRVTRTVMPFVRERWVPVLTFFLLAAARLALILLLVPAGGR